MPALIGMIAKSAVILITQITDERAAGLGVREAAAQNRLRPLMLIALPVLCVTLFDDRRSRSPSAAKAEVEAESPENDASIEPR